MRNPQADAQELRLGRSAFASVAHRYWREDWSRDRNYELYGRDASPFGIGSNLRIDAWRVLAKAGNDYDHDHDNNNKNDNESKSEKGVESDLNSSLAALKQLVDHKCLFSAESCEFMEAYGDAPSSIENIANWLSLRLFAMGGKGQWEALTVWESEALGVTARPNVATCELHIKLFNLKLTFVGEVHADSGLVKVRHEVIHSVREAMARRALAPPKRQPQAWSLELFDELRRLKGLEGLSKVTIDLSSHQSVRIS